MLRERAGLTVREAARVAGVQASTAGGYFGGRHLPPVSTPGVLTGLLKACGVEQATDQEAWHEALVRVRHTPVLRPTSSPAPYRGLASFQPEDAPWFFGREDLVDALVARVAAAARRLAVGTAHGLVVVVGASGSGKSSLLRAGLIPALEHGAIDGEPWPWLLLTPGANPLSELDRLLEADSATESDLLVVVDQFEELFTAGADDEQRRDFVTRLLSLSGQRSGRTVVVAGLRADFYGHATRLPGLVRALQDSQLVVGPMTAAQLRRAITEPARKAQVTLEDGLVELLLRALDPTPVGTGWTSGAAHDPGALPLLSHALLTTWQRGQQTTLRIPDYLAVGGITGAVARTADEVYQALNPAQRAAARRLFRRLVSVADGAADTHRRVTFAELGPQVEDAGSPLRVALDAFTDHRLLTTERDGVQITHDALLTAWPQLRSWVDADRVGLSTHRQLTEAALAWEAAGHDPQSLHRGGQLAAAQEWATEADHAEELTPVERSFLAAGQERAETERRAEQLTTRRLRWLVVSLVVLLLMVAGLAGYAFHLQSDAGRERDFATSRQVAGQSRRLRTTDVAQAAQLAVLAHRTATTPQARSVVLDTAAMPLATRLVGPSGALRSVSVSAAGQLVAAAGERGVVRLWSVPEGGRPQRLADLPAGDGAVLATAFSPDGRTLAVGGADRRVYLWDVSPGGRSRDGRPAPLGGPLGGAANGIHALAFSPNGTVLAAGADRTVRLWDLRDRARPRQLTAAITGPADLVHAVAFSPNGTVLAAGGADRTVRLWDVTRPGRPLPYGGGAGVPLTGSTSPVLSVAFSPDGHTVAGSAGDGPVRLWNLARMPRAWPKRAVPALPPATTLTGRGGAVNGVAFSPDGDLLAAASSDAGVLVWDAKSGVLRASLPHPAAATAVSWRDTHMLFSSCADGSARGWSLPGSPVQGLAGPVHSVTFSHDGKRLAAAAGGQAALWDVTDPTRPRPAGPGVGGSAGGSAGGVAGGSAGGHQLDGASALSPDGALLAAGTRAGTVLLWNVAEPARPRPIGKPIPLGNQPVGRMAFSPDGRTIAVAVGNGTVQLVDVAVPIRASPAGKPLPGLSRTGTPDRVLDVTFSPDGRTVAAATANRTVWLWDVTQVPAPRVLGEPLRGPDSQVHAVAFSPDGRTLAAGTADHSVWLWDIADRTGPQPIGQPLTGPSNDVQAVAFSPDGTLLAAGSGDRSVWVWDVRDRTSPTVLATLGNPGGAVNAVAFSPDGSTLAAGSSDHAVWLWPVDPDRAASRICATAGDPITPENWQLSAPGLPYRTIC
jgi:WD40 repeat protein